MKDPRELAAYSFADAGRLLTVHPSTIRNWAKGHDHFRPVLTLPADASADAVAKLAEEYDRTPEQVEQVLQYESARRAA